MAISITQPNFDPGAFSGKNDFNFVSTFDLMKRDVDSELKVIYRGQVMNLLNEIGNVEYMDIKSFQTEHYEENHIMPKVLATNPASVAGDINILFTLPGSTGGIDEILNVPNVNPFIGASGVTLVPVRVYDEIMVGTVRGLVTSVDPANGEFTATPIDDTEAFPTSSTSREIIIYSNSFGDGSDQNTPLTVPYTKVISYLQNIKNTISWNDTFENLAMYTGDGKEYVLRGEANALLQQMNFVDGALLLSKPLANSALGGGATPRVKTRGLIPQAKDGYNQSYTTANGYDLDDIENLMLNLDIRKGGNAFMMLEGAQFSSSANRGLIEVLKAGAISYGEFQGDQQKVIDFNFKGFNYGLISFFRKRLSWMSDPQGGGAAGQTFSKDAIVIPMDMTKDAKSNKPLKRVTKLSVKGMEMITIPRDLRRIGDTGTAKLEVTYDSWAGLKCVGSQQFAYISGS
jgi:hypothetical protein